jgi:hypothetical protein
VRGFQVRANRQQPQTPGAGLGLKLAEPSGVAVESQHACAEFGCGKRVAASAAGQIDDRASRRRLGEAGALCEEEGRRSAQG